ncbi:MAG: hypothetical protein WCJ81_04915 [bacterium]
MMQTQLERIEKDAMRLYEAAFLRLCFLWLPIEQKFFIVMLVLRAKTVFDVSA